MQKTDKKQSGTKAHRKVASSTQKSRKTMKRPTLSAQPQLATATNASQSGVRSTSVSAQPSPAMDMQGIHKKMRERTNPAPIQVQKRSAQEIKQQAIVQAIRKANAQTSSAQKKKKSSDTKFHFGFGRILLALACAGAAVFAIVYFVNLNSPDISLKVAAMQTGIEASYPSYVPRDYSLSDITSEDGKVTLNFTNVSTGDAYTLIEEKFSWDSNALLSNYVKKTYGEDYTTIRENGLTIYVHNSDAAWVNGGVVYKLVCKAGSLTKKQIRAIAVSL